MFMKTTYRLVIYPEGEPRDNDDHHGGQVDGDDVEGDLPDEQELHLEATVLSSGRLDVAVLIASIAQDKSSRQTQIIGKLQSSVFLPNVNKVIFGPTI